MTYHIPVMLDETLEGLNVKPNGLYFDGTLGGGGHSEAILTAGGNLIATDRDTEAIAFVKKRFEGRFEGRYTLVNANFKDIADIFEREGIDEIDGAVLDLGISSNQIDKAERGFSYMSDGALDMRMDKNAGLSAAEVVNTYTEQRLSEILFRFGEERFSRRIAAAIVKRREEKPIETTAELSEIITKAVPYNPKGGHPAKRSFMGIRIEVNAELEGLDTAIEYLTERLKCGGRLAVISFHSLEDRIVKQTFKTLATGCVCDKSLPVCVCGHREVVKLIRKQKPTESEIERNPRSASATLRVVEKL